MRTVLTRVAWARVIVAGKVVGEIGAGLLLLTAVGRGEDAAAAHKHAAKLAGLRVFPAGEKAYDLDVRQAGGAALAVSNFTVAAATAKGRRPSLDPAAPPAEAAAVFEAFLDALRGEGVTVATGRFGADMRVESANDGPTTFVVET